MIMARQHFHWLYANIGEYDEIFTSNTISLKPPQCTKRFADYQSGNVVIEWNINIIINAASFVCSSYLFICVSCSRFCSVIVEI